ncbi:hypothetical protein HYC85_000313 [Camellia sinensis]|uniref:histidine kinase n=1 Tax=Camellia sinensis TaxID=4442 RepID=A0A7J7I3X1_CAMSI|nr:hypothetical protein HYC85_000313 [Camellia sinensis]
MLCLFRSLRVAAASPASGLPNPLLCLVSVCEPDSVFSVSFPEGEERSRRPSLSGRRLHLVAVGHFAHFGARFPVFGAVRPCASVRDRLTISYYSSFWHTSYFLPFEGHWGLRNPLRGRTPLSVLNSHFSGPRTACFGPRAFVLHRFLFNFGRYLCFITRKVTEGWEASNCCISQLSLLRSLPAPVFPTSGPMLNTLGLLLCRNAISAYGCNSVWTQYLTGSYLGMNSDIRFCSNCAFIFISFRIKSCGSVSSIIIFRVCTMSNAGDTIGVNYMGMDVTDQVRKREKMAKLREEIAVQKAKETELNKTIHITEETMRAKQMLATMSHEIRSPLSGVVSMAEILSTTNLDKEQRQLLSVMLSSRDLVLQLINDILDLSKVESGVMKLEAAKFRPREVVRHVLQTAAASLQKILTLEGHVADDVPAEVIGDVLRIRQILTNLINNAIKFTHEGKVGMKLYVVPAPSSGMEEGSNQKITADRPTVSVNVHEQDKCLSLSQSCCDQKGFHEEKHGEGPYKNHTLDDEPKTPVRNGASIDGGEENHLQPNETIVWICCDVYDTVIGIPENALPTLFKKYIQVNADTARKYGGTGLGLAICKQLVELMGGHLSVSSREHHGSTFTFILPYKVSPAADNSDDLDELLDMADHDAPDDANDDDTSSGFFQFQPRTLEDSYSFPSSNIATKEVTSLEDARSVDGANTSLEHESSMRDSPDSAKKTAVGSDSEIQCHNKENGKFQNPDMNSTHPSRESNIGETIKAIDSQEASEMWERTNKSTQCSPSNSPKIPKSTFKPKILLVEDNKINVMVTRSMMKQLGHIIDVVNNGVEAVRTVQSCTYDLVLMDVCMPVMDGLQAIRLIRSLEETGSWDAAVKAGIEQFVPPNDQKFESSKKRMPIIVVST